MLWCIFADYAIYCISVCVIKSVDISNTTGTKSCISRNYWWVYLLGYHATIRAYTVHFQTDWYTCIWKEINRKPCCLLVRKEKRRNVLQYAMWEKRSYFLASRSSDNTHRMETFLSSIVNVNTKYLVFNHMKQLIIWLTSKVLLSRNGSGVYFACGDVRSLVLPRVPLWTIHNGVFDAPTVYILTWPRLTVSVLTIYCIQRQYVSF